MTDRQVGFRAESKVASLVVVVRQNSFGSLRKVHATVRLRSEKRPIDKWGFVCCVLLAVASRELRVATTGQPRAESRAE